MMNQMGWIAGVIVALALGIVVWRWLQRKAEPPIPPEWKLPAAPATPVPVAPPAEGMSAPAARETPSASPLRLVNALALSDARVGNAQAPLESAATQLLMGASQEFARIGTETRYTPRRPSLLPQLMEAVNDEDASLKALSRIIAQDPALTGELLRTANSALYRVSGSPIESVERAAAMLGTQGLRTLIAAALVKPLATDANAASGRFGEITWEHSLYGASAAEAWAARSQDCDPFTAHLLGLMHGLGDVAVYRVLLDMYARTPGAAPDALVIAHALETQGAVTARRIAASWGLSERTQEALEAQSAAAPSLEVTPLARALRFGRFAGAVVLLCRHQQLDEAAGWQMMEAAGFSGPQVQRIWDRLVRAYVRP
jgi:HD-like signal output (HDOD) protein